MIINHATTVRATAHHRDVAEKVSRTESEILERRRTVESMAAAVQETSEEIAAAAARAASLERTVRTEVPEDDSDDSKERIASLEEDLLTLDKQVAVLREQEGDATRTYNGEGRRQYLTGLRVSGERILILVDTSASMLSDTIVDVLRRRNMSEERRRSSPKWKRAVATVDWITAQIPAKSRFQLVAFDVKARSVLGGAISQWLDTGSGQRLTEAVDALRRIVPRNGTSLQRAFSLVAGLSPRPDSVYLLTDGLPTQGASVGRRGTVSGDQRLRLYRDAVGELPDGIPVHVILFPIEGDPLAASVFWQLGQVTGGTFLSPSVDWP